LHGMLNPGTACANSNMLVSAEFKFTELVIRDAAGKIQGIPYDELAPLLLSKMQQQQRINVAQAEEIDNVKRRQGKMEEQLAELRQINQAMRAALMTLQAGDQRIAMR